MLPRRILNIAKSLIYGRKGISPSVDRYLREHGDEPAHRPAVRIDAQCRKGLNQKRLTALRVRAPASQRSHNQYNPVAEFIPRPASNVWARDE